jgi:4-hydroxy-tetrahydrodipicolinate synthase
MQKFSGIWVPLVTPFGPDGAVDAAALTGLVRRLVEAGVHGFVVCGTTGEPAALSDAEKAVVLDTVLAACGDRPVLMGASGITPSEVAAQCKQWSGRRIAGFLVPPPCYVRPTQQGVIDFYGQVAAAAAPHALIVYDIPYRTGVELTLATLRTLAGIPGVRGVKDCGGDAHKTQALIADAQLDLLAGEDHLIFTHLCQGGSGAIAASAHLHPQHFVAMFEALRDARLTDARAAHHALAPLVAALFAEPNPAPLKAVLASLGQIGPALRPPMTPASDAAAARAQAAHAKLALCCAP